jgi:hypothetical protein
MMHRPFIISKGLPCNGGIDAVSTNAMALIALEFSAFVLRAVTQAVTSGSTP